MSSDEKAFEEWWDANCAIVQCTTDSLKRACGMAFEAGARYKLHDVAKDVFK